VTLAVALLKNRNGEIDINLPISGSLNDPEFSIGGLVVKVIVNLLVKAVTSPFALLGSVFGGGEELSNVDFAFGQALMTPPAQQRLEKSGQGADRPAGAQARNRRACRPGERSRGIEARSPGSQGAGAETRGSDEEGCRERLDGAVEVDAKEYPVLLERVYRAEKFPKPRNLVGMVKGLPVEEMEKLILANTVADEEELRDLADRRAKAVWTAGARGSRERLFLLPVKLVASDGKADAAAQARESRVALSLK
jgi:hypothetical protein